MLIPVDNSPDIDTDRDLRPEERHILQKLFCWKPLVDSIAQFRQKKKAALAIGWNNSGPVRESRALTLVIQQMEKEIQERLKDEIKHDPLKDS